MESNFIVGPGSIIEDVDDAACTLLGYSRDELLGVHGSELVPREAHPATAASIDRMRRGELTFRTAVLQRKDGALVRVEVKGQPLADGRLALRVRERRPS